MAEQVHLVTWDSYSVQALKGSDWVCPPEENLDLLDELSQNGDILESDIEIAGGRRQHLQLVTFAEEGFHAVRVVSSDTGEILTHPNAARRYEGPLDASIVGFLTIPSSTAAVLANRPIPVPDRMLQIVSVENTDDGTSTVTRIAPVPVGIGHPDYNVQSMTRMSISLQARRFSIVGCGRVAVGASHELDVCLSLAEEQGQSQANLVLSRDTGREQIERLDIFMDGTGATRQIKVYGHEVLDHLGIAPDFLGGAQLETLRISNPEYMQIILDPVAELLGLRGWGVIDPRLTAMTLYAMLDQQPLDPSRALIQKD